jgi:hypothetical protein
MQPCVVRRSADSGRSIFAGKEIARYFGARDTNYVQNSAVELEYGIPPTLKLSITCLEKPRQSSGNASPATDVASFEINFIP